MCTTQQLSKEIKKSAWRTKAHSEAFQAIGMDRGHKLTELVGRSNDS